MSVNISARQLQHPEFATEVAVLLRHCGLDPSLLILEITERVMVGDDPNDRAFVTAIVRLGQSLGLDMIAEGVEHPEHVLLLQGLRCGLGQGYLLGRPMSSGGIADLLVTGRPLRPTLTVAGTG